MFEGKRKIVCAKGQLISKGHFVFFNSFKKQMKNFCPKGQIKPNAVWAPSRFSQKTNKRICFVCREKQTKQIHSFIFWKNLRRVNLLLVSSDL